MWNLLARMNFHRAIDEEAIETDKEIARLARERQRDEQLVETLNAIVRSRGAR